MLDRVAIAPTSEDPTEVAAIVERARRRGFTRFVLEAGFPFERGSTEEHVVREHETLRIPGQDGPVPIHSVDDLPALEQLLAQTPDGGLLAVAWSGDRVIPLEWAVAQRGRRFQLWTMARSPGEAPAALGALEH